jgi:GT2 family glycosyltransferase
MPERPLAIIPTYVRSTHDIAMFKAALHSLRETVGHTCDVLVVDDGSPDDDLVSALGHVCRDYNAELRAKLKNTGFATTVNYGLKRCLKEGRDAILVNADIEFGLTKDWLSLMERQPSSDGKGNASVVGALLLYPNGLIQHAGVYFSFLTRDFNHRFNYGPGDLPEAQHATVCPVTGALQFIRHECLEGVGLYDEHFKLGWEDVDYCIRVWQSGRECVYQPGVRAIHHESFFRGRQDPKIQRWTYESWMYFKQKHADTSFAEFVPNLLSVA